MTRKLTTMPMACALICKATLAIAQGGPAPCVFDVEPREQTLAAAARMLDVLVEDGFRPPYGPLVGKHERNPRRPFSDYIVAAGNGISIAIAFHNPISSGMSAADIQQAVAFIANDGYPVPGLDNFEHWKISARTPQSSTEDGIEILSADSNGLHLRVTYPRLFALYGADLRSDIWEWADAATPESCFFQIRQDFAGTIEIFVKLDW